MGHTHTHRRTQPFIVKDNVNIKLLKRETCNKFNNLQFCKTYVLKLYTVSFEIKIPRTVMIL